MNDSAADVFTVFRNRGDGYLTAQASQVEACRYFDLPIQIMDVQFCLLRAVPWKKCLPWKGYNIYPDGGGMFHAIKWLP